MAAHPLLSINPVSLPPVTLTDDAAGWSKRRDGEQAWLCPQCARKNDLELIAEEKAA